MNVWEGLNPPYATIVADPPWHMPKGSGVRSPAPSGRNFRGALRPPPYSAMTNDEIAALPVSTLALPDAHLYLWTTGYQLRSAFTIVESWGFKFSQVLTWCKAPRELGPGWAFSNTTEFILFCRQGSLPYEDRVDTTWWEWSRGVHSAKPAAFIDVVERVSPGPYVELFARAPRLGWDSWGKGYDLSMSLRRFWDKLPPVSGETPRERWGTCCPYDPACVHSYLTNEELTAWLDSPIPDSWCPAGGEHVLVQCEGELDGVSRTLKGTWYCEECGTVASNEGERDEL